MYLIVVIAVQLYKDTKTDRIAHFLKGWVFLVCKLYINKAVTLENELKAALVNDNENFLRKRNQENHWLGKVSWLPVMLARSTPLFPLHSDQQVQEHETKPCMSVWNKKNPHSWLLTKTESAFLGSITPKL